MISGPSFKRSKLRLPPFS
jgi:hypothetical protein